MGASSEVTRDGLGGVRPGREARIGENAGTGPGGGGGGRRRSGRLVGEPEFHSYYGLPVIKRPTWKPLDIAGYLFLGGLAGASSVLAAASGATGRTTLARRLQAGAAVAVGGSVVALVHDLGRPSRFYNMLRVLKPTSPMSVGSWILAAYGPATIGTAVLGHPSLLPGPLRWAGRLRGPAGAAAAVLGPAVATYTGVLLADTAVPAWHGGHREMPFVFAGSAASAAGGLGLVVGPASEAGPARRLAVAGAAAELVAGRVMRQRMGPVAECYEEGKAGRLMRAAETLTAVGAVLAAVSAFPRRPTPLGRAVSVAAGASLLGGSALTRFGVFHAGVRSAEDPRYTVEPQRRALGPRAR